MSGYVSTTIWPLYEASEAISWYPVIAVLNTTSPDAGDASPNASPHQTEPSSSPRTAALVIDA